MDIYLKNIVLKVMKASDIFYSVLFFDAFFSKTM